jgi:microcystin-dependent protein
MADPFVGELRLVGFNFAPSNWATASGQILAISQNTPLFSLLGTRFGGNGTSTFGLPNLQGSIPVGAGQGPGLSDYTVGEVGGQPNETLLQAEMPVHTHTVRANIHDAGASTPANNAFGKGIASAGNLYTTNTTPTVQMNAGAISSVGGNLPHNNMMPYLTLNWIISLYGVFPARG